MNRGAALALGTNMTAAMILGGIGGHYLDNKRAENSGVYTMVGLFLGLFYCGYEVWKLVRDTDNDEPAS